MSVTIDNQPVTELDIALAEADLKERQHEDPLQGLRLQNVPPIVPKPEWFDRALMELGGPVPGQPSKPRYRLVWGMDETVKQFAMGKVRMKYAAINDTIQELIGHTLLKPDGTRQYFNIKKSDQMFYDPVTKMHTRNVKPGELLLPHYRENVIEIGSPWWIVEQWAPPEAFAADRAEWDRERYMCNPVQPEQYIDVLGDYPDKGDYVHWLDLITYVGEEKEQRIELLELNDGTFEYIRSNHIMNEVMRKKAVYDSAQKRKEVIARRLDDEWENEKPSIMRDMLAVKKNRVFSLPTIRKNKKAGK